MRPDAMPLVPTEVPAGLWGWLAPDGVRAVASEAELRAVLEADAEQKILLAFGPPTTGPDGLRRMAPVHEVLPAVGLTRDSAARQRSRRRELSGFALALAALAGLLYLLFSGGSLSPLVVIAVIVFGMTPFERAIDLVDNQRAAAAARRDPVSAARRAAVRTRYALWAARQPRGVAGVWLVGCFVIVLALQYSVGLRESVEIAGLVKAQVLTQPYRLITAAYLHIGVIHLVFNSLMTLALARTLESLIGPGRLLWVFLVGALGGNLCSWLFLDVSSAGASGGIMALVGALGGLALRHPGLRVVGLGRLALRIVLLMVVVGLVGAHMIDNAAHAGGALTGFALGAWLAPNAAASPQLSTNIRTRLAGMLVATLPALLCGWLLL